MVLNSVHSGLDFFSKTYMWKVLNVYQNVPKSTNKKTILFFAEEKYQILTELWIMCLIMQLSSIRKVMVCNISNNIWLIKFVTVYCNLPGSATKLTMNVWFRWYISYHILAMNFSVNLVIFLHSIELLVWKVANNIFLLKSKTMYKYLKLSANKFTIDVFCIC